ncbi:MAG TPA: ABC transporter substrate-binding protein [Chloroflexota bacterium]|nr:ABC transporter substrate-binding protein [Chloroflexota bacterium]
MATASNLVGTLGPSSDEALATLPLFQRSHIPSFVDSGQAALDHSSDPYMWRILPADDVKGYAMAVWARRQGFSRAAVMFGNDIGSQGVVPTLTRGFSKLGGAVVINEQLVLDQSSYRTEIERMLQAKPQVILTEMDPQSSATFLAQLQQLHGTTIPIISTEIALQTPWYQAVSRAIGKSATARMITGVEYYTPTAGASWRVYDAALKPSGHKESDWGNDPYTMSYYDSVNLLCLAMQAAKSTDPAVFNRSIATVTTGTTPVTSFADGKRALAAGKTIRYIGAAGPVEFNQFHNSVGTFEAARYDAKGNIVQAGVLSQSAITALTR